MYKILSFVGRNWPFSKGKGWLVDRPARIIKKWPATIQFKLKDGRIVKGDLNDGLFKSLYLYGVYEPLLTKVITKLIRPGDVVIDVGANIGLISIQLGKLVSPGGKVYSFEPVPTTFKKLKDTIRLNNLIQIIIPENKAVSNKQELTTIYVPQKRSHACSSLKKSEKAYSFPCETITLNSLQQSPTFIKIDVEGAELMVLEGADLIFKKEHSPIVVMEVNRKAANQFGYEPEELLKILAKSNYHRFYYSDDYRGIPLKPEDKMADYGTMYAIPKWAIEQNRIPF
jgi:FkbM family methyltransferase